MAEPVMIPLDHDQRFKALIRLCFPEFLQLFFPEWAERFDFDSLSWLDKKCCRTRRKGRVICWT